MGWISAVDYSLYVTSSCRQYHSQLGPPGVDDVLTPGAGAVLTPWVDDVLTPAWGRRRADCNRSQQQALVTQDSC